LPDWDGCAQELIGIYRRVLNDVHAAADEVIDRGLGTAQREL
jgi:hypothetical protein